jgi:hypothetical protein
MIVIDKSNELAVETGKANAISTVYDASGRQQQQQPTGIPARFILAIVAV